MAWGENADAGELGDGTFTNHLSPEAVSTANGLPACIALAAGNYFSLALGADGSVWSWGTDEAGQLGNGSDYANPLSPAHNIPSLVSGITGAIAISAGDQHGLAVTADGTAWGWGYNVLGQLGDGTTTERDAPVQVCTASSTPLSGVIAVSAGGLSSLALKADGTVWAWGWNYFGQLGIGNTTDQHYAVQVTGLSHVVAIAAGYDHCLALTSDGNVWAWGWNYYGQLGDGSTTTHSSPEQISGVSGVIALAAQENCSLALMADGTVWSWGEGDTGALGLGSLSNSQPSPKNIPGFYATTLGTGSISETLHLLKISPTAFFCFNPATGNAQFDDPYDPSATETAAGLHYAYDFYNNGTFEVGDGSYAGSVAQNTAAVTNYLTAPGTYTIHGRMIDSLGGSTDYYTTLTLSGTVNHIPTLDVIANQTVSEDCGTQTIDLTGISDGLGDTGQTLTITATSSNTAIVPNPAISYTNPNATGTLSYTPVTGALGTVTITVTVQDNGGIANGGVDTLVQTFIITVLPATPRDVVLAQVIAEVSGIMSTTVQVPITLTAQGDENALGASITFDPTVLCNPQLTLGTDDPTAALIVNNINAATGLLAFAVALPAAQTFTAGTPQVAMLTFTLVSNSYSGLTPVTFSDLPVTCEIIDDNADYLNATWQNGSVYVNHPPVAVNDSYSLNENTTLTTSAPGVLLNDTDADKDPLTAVLLTGPSNGTLILNANGSFTYTPAHNYVETDSFTYQAYDGMAYSNSATVTLTVNPLGYEGDVAKRPDGDGKLDIADWVQEGRYVAGLDIAAPGSEFMRADCAPLATKGDGHLTVADWVQVGRFVLGLDPLTSIGGPDHDPPLAGGTRAMSASRLLTGKTARALGIDAATLTRGKAGAVCVSLNALGNESALGFSVHFDAKHLKFVSAKVVGATVAATLLVNANAAAQGNLGVALMLPLPTACKAGKGAVVEFTFLPLATGATPLTFSDQVVSCEIAGATATALPANFVNGTVLVRP